MIGHGRRDSGPVDSKFSRRANEETKTKRTKHPGEIAGAQERRKSPLRAHEGGQDHREERRDGEATIKRHNYEGVQIWHDF